MDLSSFGLPSVAAITVICFLFGLGTKATPWNNDKYIPVVCGVVGGLLGVVMFYIPMTQFPASDPVSALAVGVVSGLAATGANQVFKQLKQ